MRELVYYIGTTLDGYIAAPDHSYDAFPVVGPHIDLIVREYTDTLPGPALQAMGLSVTNERFDTVLMGWNTYSAGLAVGVDDPYPHLQQVVFSRRRAREAGIVPDHIHITDENPLTLVQRLKREPGRNIWLCGGSGIASDVFSEIDRMILKVYPLTFGDGIPLFARREYAAQPFRLLNSTVCDNGVIFNEYVRLP